MVRREVELAKGGCLQCGGPDAVVRAWYGKRGAEWQVESGCDVTEKVKGLLRQGQPVSAETLLHGVPTHNGDEVLQVELVPRTADTFLHDEPMDEPWRSDADLAALDADAGTRCWENALFGCPRVEVKERMVEELGQRDGDARYHQLDLHAVGLASISKMTRVKFPRLDWLGRLSGISYIVGENELELASAGMLKLTTKFKLHAPSLACELPKAADGNVVGCGFVAGQSKVHVHIFGRAVLQADVQGGPVTPLGTFNMAVLSTSTPSCDDSYSATVLWDEAPTNHVGQTIHLEEWRNVNLNDEVVETIHGVSDLEDARKRALAWIAEGGAIHNMRTAVLTTHTSPGTLYLKQLVRPGPGILNHPCSYYAGQSWCADFRHRDTFFFCLPASARQDIPPALLGRQPCSEVVVMMDLHIYKSKKFAWLGVTLETETGPVSSELLALRKRIELRTPLNEDDYVPPGTVGVSIRSEGVRVSPLYVSRYMTDFVELCTELCWVRMCFGIMVLAFWSSMILFNPLVVESFLHARDDGEDRAPTVRLCFWGFLLSTAALVWSEIRLALCCKRGQELLRNRRVAFALAMALSCLEKYDTYGDLNFVRIARQHHPDGLIWRVGLAAFIVGVGVMQILPSLVLLTSCVFNGKTCAGVPKDFVLCCRFSGLHLLMESINPRHAAAAEQVLQPETGQTLGTFVFFSS